MAAGWKKARGGERGACEAFLRSREPRCVAACARFLSRETGDCLWSLRERSPGALTAILLYSHRCLYPLFDGRRDLPPLRFLGRFLAPTPLHAVQGQRDDVDPLEAELETEGCFPRERVDYLMMTRDHPAPAPPPPPGLLIRRPQPADTEELVWLQAAYEKEEVLAPGAELNLAVTRANLERVLARQEALVALWRGRIVGKINTSAASFTRWQIGGVYVTPPCRGRGIAQALAGAFADLLLAKGRGLSLFVKQTNAPAQTVYRRVGFTPAGPYRITYY